MPNFKSTQFEIKKEKEAPAETRVVKIENGVAKEVKEFEFQKIKKNGEHDYGSIKAKYGPLAATDTDRASRNRKDARFSLNPLLRGPLSVEEEERRAIEERVQDRVQALWNETKAKAHEDGYREGLKVGHDEAYKKFQEDGANRLKAFDSFITHCENAKTEIFRANERLLVELVFKIGKMILMKELSTDKDYVIRLATDLLEKIGARENITIRLNPAQLETAGMIREGIEKQLGALKNINFEASDQVAGGGCAIETEWSAIDASVCKQLEGVYQALIGDTKNDHAEQGENGRSSG
jgi:flagellar assembly protein FliH